MYQFQLFSLNLERGFMPVAIPQVRHPAKSAYSDAMSLLGQMHEAIARPTINRDHLQNLSDQISTLMMAQLTPAVDERFLTHFTGEESRILQYLADRAGKAVSKSALLEACAWHRGAELPQEKVIQVFVCWIRRKIVAHNLPYRLETVWGIGYRLVKLEA